MRGKDWELIEEMKKYDLGILGISETKWKGSGAKDIGDTYTIHSGVNKGRARAVVAVVLSEQMRRSWKCISEQIVVVKLKVSRECYTLVQVYAPIDDSMSEAKDKFNAELQRVVEEVGRIEILIVIGEVNARVGRNTKVCGSVLGCHGEDVINESGGKVAEVLFSE